MIPSGYIGKKQFADQMGVYPSAISSKFPKGHPALKNNKIDLSHESVLEYIAEREIRRKQTPPNPNSAQPVPNPGFIAPVIPEDIPKPQLPEELAELTLQEIINLYGHLPAFKSYVTSLKELESLRLKTTKSRHERGLLIEKTREGRVVLDILEMCFKKLVNEVPKDSVRRIISIVRKNDADTELQAVKALQEVNSRALNICKNEILTRLEMTEEELIGGTENVS